MHRVRSIASRGRAKQSPTNDLSSVPRSAEIVVNRDKLPTAAQAPPPSSPTRTVSTDSATLSTRSSHSGGNSMGMMFLSDMQGAKGFFEYHEKEVVAVNDNNKKKKKKKNRKSAATSDTKAAEIDSSSPLERMVIPSSGSKSDHNTQSTPAVRSRTPYRRNHHSETAPVETTCPPTNQGLSVSVHRRKLALEAQQKRESKAEHDDDTVTCASASVANSFVQLVLGPPKVVTKAEGEIDTSSPLERMVIPKTEEPTRIRSQTPARGLTKPKSDISQETNNATASRNENNDHHDRWNKKRTTTPYRTHRKSDEALSAKASSHQSRSAAPIKSRSTTPFRSTKTTDESNCSSPTTTSDRLSSKSSHGGIAVAAATLSPVKQARPTTPFRSTRRFDISLADSRHDTKTTTTTAEVSSSSNIDTASALSRLTKPTSDNDTPVDMDPKTAPKSPRKGRAVSRRAGRSKSHGAMKPVALDFMAAPLTSHSSHGLRSKSTGRPTKQTSTETPLHNNHSKFAASLRSKSTGRATSSAIPVLASSRLDTQRRRAVP